MPEEPDIRRTAYIKFLQDIVATVDSDAYNDALRDYHEKYDAFDKLNIPNVLLYLITNTIAEDRYVPFEKFIKTLYQDEDYVCALLDDEEHRKQYLKDIEQLFSSII